MSTISEFNKKLAELKVLRGNLKKEIEIELKLKAEERKNLKQNRTESYRLLGIEIQRRKEAGETYVSIKKDMKLSSYKFSRARSVLRYSIWIETGQFPDF